MLQDLTLYIGKYWWCAGLGVLLLFSEFVPALGKNKVVRLALILGVLVTGFLVYRDTKIHYKSTIGELKAGLN